MDPRPSRVDTFEATRIQGPEWFFTYYHPERPPYQMDQYAFFLIDEYEGIEESRYNFSSVSNFPSNRIRSPALRSSTLSAGYSIDELPHWFRSSWWMFGLGDSWAT